MLRGRTNVDVFYDLFHQRVLNYHSCTSVLVSRAPPLVQRLFGGLLWVRLVGGGLLYASAGHAAVQYTPYPAKCAAVVLVTAAVELVLLLAAAFTSPGRCRGAPIAGHHGVDGAAVQQNGAPCEPCQRLRPIRSVHCNAATCGACIPKYDHHSPWLNTCIGARNQGAYFVNVVAWAVANAVVLLATLNALFVQLVRQNRMTPASLLYMVCVVAAAPLLFYSWQNAKRHWRLIKINMTSYEQTNRRFLTYFKGTPGFINPFDKGEKLNIKAVFGLVKDTDWEASNMYSVIDIPNHPMRLQAKEAAKALKRRQEAGESLTDRELVFIERSRALLEEDANGGSLPQGVSAV